MNWAPNSGLKALLGCWFSNRVPAGTRKKPARSDWSIQKLFRLRYSD